MRIIVNGKEAVLKQGFSFDYVSENRLFLGREGYSLTVAFLLRGCPRNIDIFGHIGRADVSKANLTYECAIEYGANCLFGALSVVKVSDSGIECQFAQGKSCQTMTDPFEDTYINKLDLGEYPEGTPTTILPNQAWDSIDNGAVAVALPWINDSYPTSPNNWVSYKDGGYLWHPEMYYLSWQPYLLSIAKRMCDAIGYTYDFREWEESAYRHIIVCNSIPGSWGEQRFSAVMPKWTVAEFFEKLELFLMAEFDFDHKAKYVRMRFTSNVLSEIAPVRIDDVVDEYSAEIAEDNKCEYIASKRLMYKECDHAMQNYYACDWLVYPGVFCYSYPDLDTLIEKNKKKILSGNRVSWGHGHDTANRGPQGASVNCLLYAEKEDTYFVFRSIGVEETGHHFNGNPVYTQVYVLQSANTFGSGMKASDDVADEEIGFVPVCITDTYVSKDDDMGFMMTLRPASTYDSGSSVVISDSGETSRPGNMGQSGASVGYDSSEVQQPSFAAKIEAGDSETDSEYYNEIYVGFWDGTVPDPGVPPCPVIDSVWVSQDWRKVTKPGFDLRLYRGSSRLRLSGFPEIDPRQKFKFSWIGTSIPNPRAIFYIHGKRYLCEKITATFTERGMSQLLKGEFYPLLDD